MNYFLIPGSYINIGSEHLKIRFRNESDSDKYLSQTLAKCLNKIKLRIRDHPVEWDNIKKLTNGYEYIHTVIPNSKNSVSKIKPLSRAFFKLVEICNTFDVFGPYGVKPIQSFHLAEGPGGFIEAMTYLRFNDEDKYYGMTLLDTTNENVPGWKKSALFLRKNRNVIIEKGKDGTGDLYSPENFIWCCDNYKNGIDLITADGGFDFSIDFNKQEALALRLIMSEVMYALVMQKKGGTLALKMFDTFLKSSVDIIFLLTCFYKSVYIMKPNTSRSANSEKYIICKGFKYSDTSHLVSAFNSLLVIMNNPKINDMTIASLLDIPIPYRFRVAIEEVNAIIGSQQIDNILTTLRFIENKERKGEKIQQIKNGNIQKCISWCIKNKIPHNKSGSTGNIFMSDQNKKLRKSPFCK